MPEADAKSNRTYSGHAHLSRNVERAIKGQAAHLLPFRAAQPPGRRTHATLGSENFAAKAISRSQRPIPGLNFRGGPIRTYLAT